MESIVSLLSLLFSSLILAPRPLNLQSVARLYSGTFWRPIFNYNEHIWFIMRPHEETSSAIRILGRPP